MLWDIFWSDSWAIIHEERLKSVGVFAYIGNSCFTIPKYCGAQTIQRSVLQHDWYPAHYTVLVRLFLDQPFAEKLIVRFWSSSPFYSILLTLKQSIYSNDLRHDSVVLKGRYAKQLMKRMSYTLFLEVGWFHYQNRKMCRSVS